MPTKNSAAAIPKGHVPLTGSEMRAVPRARLKGPADDRETITVTIVLRRRPDGPRLPDFDHFKTAPAKRRRITREEFAGKYGAHPDEIAKVVAFAQGAGLKVVRTQTGRRVVKATGTVSQMSRAFGVSLGNYERATFRRTNRKQAGSVESFRGREGSIHVPGELAPYIIGVFGLENPLMAQRSVTGDPPIANPLTMQQVTEAYNFPPPGPGIAGQTIGVLSASADYGGYLPSDLALYFGPLGLTPQIIPIQVDGCVNATGVYATMGVALAGQLNITFASVPIGKSGTQIQFTTNGTDYYYFQITAAPVGSTVQIGHFDHMSMAWVADPLPINIPSGTQIYFNLDFETNQDICLCASAAAGANVAVYFFFGGGSGWVDVINRVIEPEAGDFPPGVNPPSVLTLSYSFTEGDDPTGLSEYGYTPAFLTAMAAANQDAALFDITICASSGDFGSNSYLGRMAPSDNPPITYDGDGFAHVSYPASDPWVLGVGGTTLGQYLPAGSMMPAWVEYAWNDPFTDPSYSWGTGGGGVSDFFPLPSYQAAAGVPNSINTNPALTPVAGANVAPPVPFFNAIGRGVPDVAANASINTGFSGLYVGGVLGFPGNGTSASSPFWAGLIAVLNSNLGYNVGFVNPLFYEWGPSLFSPINPLWPDPAFPQLVLPLPAGCPVDNGNNGIPGYPTGPGWDACTGLGSPNGTALLAAFQALGSPYVLGGYQSPDIIITNITTSATGMAGTPVPLGGIPGSAAWDTLLTPGLPYGLQVTIHNGSSMNEAYVDSVSFWTVPGGVGTAGGTQLATINPGIAIPPGGSITVPPSYSTVQFTNSGTHACAVVSIYSPDAGCHFNGSQNPVSLAFPPSEDIPDPGPSNSHSCSAWRNTDTLSAAMGAAYKFKLGFGRPPKRMLEPVELEIQGAHVPFDWQKNPKIRQVQALLDRTGAKWNAPLYLLPEFLGRYRVATLGNKISALEGGSVMEKDGRWLLTTEAKAKATSFEVSGKVPNGAKKGDILLVNVTAHYPATAEGEARSVGFLEFIYVTEKIRLK
jgi:hypothetical protein